MKKKQKQNKPVDTHFYKDTLIGILQLRRKEFIVKLMKAIWQTL